MKNIFNKFAFFIALSFVFISCGNLTTSENDDSIPQGKGKITISTDLQNGRSVLPTAIKEDTEGLKWELVGIKDGTQQIIESWTDGTDETGTVTVTAYQSMTSDSKIVIDTGTWDFTLTASQDNATEELNVLQAQCNSVQISAGNNFLNFVMQEATEKAASGSIEFTLNFPENVVTKGIATLTPYEGTNPDTQDFTANAGTTSQFLSSITYINENISAGYYILKIQLQQEGYATTPEVEYINTYSCLIRVAPGLTSYGVYTLDKLAQLYTIKYECGRGNIENQLTTTSYNAYTSFELPEPTYQGYYFAGWYTRESNEDNTITEKFFGNAGDTITINKDTTLYAKWVKAYTFNLYDSTGKEVENSYKVENGIGSVTLSNTGNSVWDYYLKSTDIFNYNYNYKITVEMKAEADSVVAIQAANSDMFFTVGKEWTTCTMETGFIEKPLDSTRNGISFGLGLSQKTYFKNLVIEQIGDDGLPTLVFDITTEGINQYLNTQNKADKIIEVEKVVDASGMATGYAITINAPLSHNDENNVVQQDVKLHLRDYAKAIGANNVSFEVKNSGEYPFATSFMADTASNNSMAWNNVRTEVTNNKYNSCDIDFPNYEANDELTVDVITGSDNVYSNYPVQFTISEFEVTNIESNATPFENKIFAIKTGNTWTQSKEVEVSIPADGSIKFDVGMFSSWENNNNNMPSFEDVTRFLYTGNISDGLTYSTGTDDSGPTYTVTNNSDSTKIVKIALNDNYEVVIEDVSSIVTTWKGLKSRIEELSISNFVIKNNLTVTETITISRKVMITADKNVKISRGASCGFFVINSGSLELGSDNCTITLDGGNTTDIYATTKGLLIWQYSGGQGVTLTNCILQNNTLHDPGYEQGAAIKTENSFTMNNCSIRNCQGSEGGAVYIFANGSFTMNGGSISGCTATAGGAVYLYNGSFTMSGDAYIDSNNDVYLAYGKTVTVAADLSKEFVATITLPAYNVGTPVITAADDNVILADKVGKFTLKNENYKISDDGSVVQNSGGGNELLIEGAYYVSANGNDSNNGLTYDTPFKTLNKAITSANNSDSKTVYVIGTLNATSESSSDSETVFFIAASVGTADSPINIIGYPDSDATLSALDDTGAANKRVFETDLESYIKMKDLILTGGNTSQSGAAIYYYNGELTLEDCKINSNKTAQAPNDSGIYYDGIYMYGTSNKLNMKNTECTDGIYLYNCTANFDDDCLLGYDDSTEIPIIHINNSSLNLGDVYFSNSIYSDAKSPICLTTSLTKHSNDEPIYIKLPNDVEGKQIISATSGVPLTEEVKKFTLSDTNYTISDDGKVVQNSGGV